MVMIYNCLSETPKKAEPMKNCSMNYWYNCCEECGKVGEY